MTRQTNWGDLIDQARFPRPAYSVRAMYLDPFGNEHVLTLQTSNRHRPTQERVRLALESMFAELDCILVSAQELVQSVTPVDVNPDTPWTGEERRRPGLHLVVSKADRGEIA